MNIDKHEALRRLNSPNNLAIQLGKVRPVTNQAVPTPENRTEKPQNVEVRTSVSAPRDRGANLSERARNNIGTLALNPNLRQQDIADAYEISQQEVSACKLGAIGGNPPNEERAAARDRRVEAARDLALSKLMASLGLIQDEDLAELKPKELAKIGVDMARIHNSLAPAQLGNDTGGVKIIVMAPPMRSEKDFKVVEVQS